MSVQRRATGKYEVRWREAGRQRSRVFARKHDAQAFDLEVKRRQQLGGLARLDSGEATLAEFVEDYWRLYAVANLKATTRAAYAHTWDKHLRPRVGDRRLREITPRVVTRLRGDLERAGLGAPTVLKALAVLQSVLTFAVVDERIQHNPVAAVRKPPRQAARRVEAIPPHAVEAIRADLLSRGRHRDAVIVTLLAYAGLRTFSEAMLLRWRDIGDRTLRVHAPKTNRDRTVALLAPLTQDLAEWRLANGRPHPTSLVFPRPDGQAWSETDWRNWRRRVYRPAADRCGLGPAARPYDLRHSFVSLLIWEGRSVAEVAAQAGHSVETCSRHYIHVFENFAPARRVTAEEQIRRARTTVARRAG